MLNNVSNKNNMPRSGNMSCTVLLYIQHSSFTRSNFRLCFHNIDAFNYKVLNHYTSFKKEQQICKSDRQDMQHKCCGKACIYKMLLKMREGRYSCNIHLQTQILLFVAVKCCLVVETHPLKH
jgi:hypothetical protein